VLGERGSGEAAPDAGGVDEGAGVGLAEDGCHVVLLPKGAFNVTAYQ